MGWRCQACFVGFVALDGTQTDWRDSEAYAPLLEADRSVLAWEWLRRDPAYRAAWQAAQSDGAEDDAARPERWGLQMFESPDLAAPHARPIWCAERHSLVLAAVAGGSCDEKDRFDLARLAPYARLVRTGAGCEHLLISDGLHALRLDVIAGTLTSGPVELRYLMSGFAAAERPLLTLRRLLSFVRTGRFSRLLHRPEPRAKRWVTLLRTSDALAVGADQREIAGILLSPTAREARWRSAAPSLRSRAQRLVRGARSMGSGGYLALLE
jgi:hypothetical protein